MDVEAKDKFSDTTVKAEDDLLEAIRNYSKGFAEWPAKKWRCPDHKSNRGYVVEIGIENQKYICKHDFRLYWFRERERAHLVKKREYLTKGWYWKTTQTLSETNGYIREVRYSRAFMLPADKDRAANLSDTEGVKSIFPLYCALGVDALLFKITCKMMWAIAKEAVRARSYADASANIIEKYHVENRVFHVEKVTDYVGALGWEEQLSHAEEAERQSHQKVDGRWRRKTISCTLGLKGPWSISETRKEATYGWEANRR